MSLASYNSLDAEVNAWQQLEPLNYPHSRRFLTTRRTQGIHFEKLGRSVN